MKLGLHSQVYAIELGPEANMILLQSNTHWPLDQIYPLLQKQVFVLLVLYKVFNALLVFEQSKTQAATSGLKL